MLLINNNTLKILNLGKNRITVVDAEELAEILRKNRTLTELYLGENEVTDDEVRMSAKSVAKDNGTLEILSLNSNPFVTNHCAIYLHPMIKQNHTLQQLWLDNCNLSRKGETTSNGTTRKKAIL